MQNLNIALLQYDQAWENKALNYKRIGQLLQGEKDIDLLLLPEMFHTGFTMNTELAEIMGESEGIHFLQAISNEKNCALYTSLIISENGRNYNRGVFIEPNKQIQLYDKRKTFGLAGEDKVYDSGTQQMIVSYQGWNINLQICYDLRFPELSANRLGENDKALFDVVLYVANWPEKRAMHWEVLLKARAIENQSFVLACNRIGTDFNNINYIGGSCGINALGEWISEETKEETLIRFQIWNKELKQIHSKLPFLKDR